MSIELPLFVLVTNFYFIFWSLQTNLLKKTCFVLCWIIFPLVLVMNLLWKPSLPPTKPLMDKTETKPELTIVCFVVSFHLVQLMSINYTFNNSITTVQNILFFLIFLFYSTANKVPTCRTNYRVVLHLTH